MEQNSLNQFAVVTGASQGLGKEFALELAKRKTNLILVSLPGQNLQKFSKELATKYGIKSYHYETDLSLTDDILNLTKWLNDNFKIFMLINNAGIGGTKKIDEVSLDYLERIIQVNIKATSFLIHQLIPNLKQQPKSYILNVSSIAAFSPVGYKTVYPASKSFIHSFSLGLSAELKDTNISVKVVNPGAMKTNMEIVKRIEKQGFLGKLTLLDPQKVAVLCLNRLDKKGTIIMVNPISWLISNIIPTRYKVSLMTKIVKREIDEREIIYNRC